MNPAERVLPSAARAAAAEAADTVAAANSRKLLLISLLLAAAGVGLLVLYLHRFETEASGGERVQLLTVLTPIPRGTVLTQEMLAVREVPVSYVEQRSVKAAELSKVRGIRTSTDLDPQDSLLWTDLAVAVEERDLSSLVQPGNRALSIEAHHRVSGASGNDLIRPGDYVDVLATFSERMTGNHAGATVVLLQRVLVLAVGSETQPQAFAANNNKPAAGARRSGNLTLSLKLDEAQMVALAAEQGELSVVLRAVSDSTVVDGIPDLTANNLMETAAGANRRRSAQVSDSALPVRITGSNER